MPIFSPFVNGKLEIAHRARWRSKNSCGYFFGYMVSFNMNREFSLLPVNPDYPENNGRHYSSRDKIRFFAGYIVVAVCVTLFFSTLQAIYIIGITPFPIMYLFPTAIGLLFGFLFGKIKLLNYQLEFAALSDLLTGLPNRMFFQARLMHEINRTKRYGSTFSLLMIDLDKFKAINDRYGHQAGDDALSEFARIALSEMRDSDICARWGGEEFVVLLVGTPLAGALIAAERFRKAVAGGKFSFGGNLTCSLGIAEYRLNDDDATLIARADSSLYQAKKSGRNCVKTEERDPRL